MAQLPDVPAAGLKVILRLLSLQDYASLRLVSRSLYQCITQHVPYISLLLTYTSGDEQLHQWFRATEKLKHVSSVHVHMPASPAAEVFELAMQLLSQRTAIIELHLLSAGEGCWSSYEKTHLGTLQPVEHLLPRLKTLVIDGMAVKNMVDDLQHLAAAAAGTGGWQLESLTLQADWRQWVDYHRINHWSEYAAALKHLTQAFPSLKYLSMSKPEMMYRLLPPQAAAAADSSISYSVSDTLSRTGVTTALANAVMQLQHLEVLQVTDALDVWMLDLISAADGDRDSLIERLRSGSGAKLNDSDFMQAVDIADVYIGDGPLTSVQDAAAAFPTFNDYGCWMLQQHPKLKVVNINCESKGWAMTWQQQQQQALYPSSSSSSTSGTLAAAAAETEAPIITSMACRWNACSRQRTRMHGQPYYGNNATLTDDFIRHLSRYSSRSADMLFGHVSNMRLSLYDQDVDQLGDLLSNLKSLKHLEISVEPRRTSNGANKVGEVAPAAAAAGIFTAAATVTGLQSLTVRLEGRDYDALPDDLLLPLTAAAGGPGSNLQKLVLIGCSATPAAAAAAAHAAEYRSGWLHALKQLTGLMTLWYLPCAPDDTKYHSFFVECLPEGLRMFRGRNLYITSSSTAAAAATAVASSSDEKHSTAVNVFGGSTPCAAALASLFLERCVLSSPSLLASEQMQHLTLDCSWSGDWTAAAMAAAAAAAAWPYARSLRWMFNSSSSKSGYASATMLQDEDSSAQNGGQSFSIHTDTDTDIEVDAEVATQLQGIYVIREIAENLKHLRSIALHHFPYLNIETVQPLLQKLSFLQHFELTAVCYMERL